MKKISKEHKSTAAGREIIAALTDLRDTLAAGIPLEEKYTVAPRDRARPGRLRRPGCPSYTRPSGRQPAGFLPISWACPSCWRRPGSRVNARPMPWHAGCSMKSIGSLGVGPQCCARPMPLDPCVRKRIRPPQPLKWYYLAIPSPHKDRIRTILLLSVNPPHARRPAPIRRNQISCHSVHCPPTTGH